MKTARLAGAFLVLAAALIACGPPKYVNYWSYWRDWRGTVPWGWNVMTDTGASGFASTNLIGPFAPEFFLGEPSFGVRYYPYRMPHTLPDGSLEYFRSADDYIKKTLVDVYGGSCAAFTDKPQPYSGSDSCALVDDSKDHKAVGQPDEIEVGIPGQKRKAKHFVVFSPALAPKGARYGVGIDPSTKQRIIPRLHEYIVIPLDAGFYVLVYPATQRGFEVYKPQFNALVNSFLIAKDGPAGASTGASFAPPPASAPAAAKTGQ
jgi:hypothetical protein